MKAIVLPVSSKVGVLWCRKDTRGYGLPCPLGSWSAAELPLCMRPRLSVALQQAQWKMKTKKSYLLVFCLILFCLFDGYFQLFFHRYCYFKDLFTISREILHFLMKSLIYKNWKGGRFSSLRTALLTQVVIWASSSISRLPLCNSITVSLL